MTSSLENRTLIQSIYQYDIQHRLIHTIRLLPPSVCHEYMWYMVLMCSAECCHLNTVHQALIQSPFVSIDSLHTNAQYFNYHFLVEPYFTVLPFEVVKDLK